MTAPIDEEDIVVALRLQPVVARPDGWRGRTSGLIAAGLVGFIVVGIALGTAFGNGRPASSAVAVAPVASVATSAPASRRPTPTRRPQLPPLPVVQVIGGNIPTEHRLVNAVGLQVLDLATGELTTRPRPWEDIVLQLADGGIVCACMSQQRTGGDAPTSSVLLRFERSSASGSPVVREVTTFEGIVEIPEMTVGFTMAATLSQDDRFLYVVTASRRPPIWTVELVQIDVGSGDLVDLTVLEEIPIDAEQPRPSASPASATPGGSPPDGVYVWTNALSRSPDGATMAVTIATSDIRGDVWTSGYRVLLLPLEGGRPGTATTLAAADQLPPNVWCLAAPEYVDNELLVQVCTSPDSPSGRLDVFNVRRLAVDGAILEHVPLRANQERGYYQLAIAVDRGRRAIFSWDPVAHALARVSLDDGTVVERDVARAMLPEPAAGGGRGYFGADPGLVLSPDGQRLYALGVGLGPSDSGTPTGVWVFDADTLDLVDRWAPRAMLTSLAVSADGQFVYAAGANGFDVEGNQASWPSSVTVYDAQTGQVQVVYGAVSVESWVSFRPLP